MKRYFKWDFGVTSFWNRWMSFDVFFLRQGHLCSPDHPWPHDPPAPASWVLGLQVYITTPSLINMYCFLSFWGANSCTLPLSYIWEVDLSSKVPPIFVIIEHALLVSYSFTFLFRYLRVLEFIFAINMIKNLNYTKEAY
jgi:hypothetical protein